jgi:ClpX C4-type zinc finger protein
MDPGDKKLHCSFCDKSQDHVRKLVTGPKACICDECVEVCVDIISDDRTADPASVEAGQERPGAPLLTVRCSLCRTSAVVEELVAVIGRGAVCRPCVSAVQAVAEDEGRAKPPA